MGPWSLEVAYIMEGPGPEAASSARELQVSMMKVPGGIETLALRQKPALPPYTTFPIQTLLPEE